MNQNSDRELVFHIEDDKEIEFEEIAFQSEISDGRRQVSSDQEKTRLNEVLLAVAEMGFNSFLAEHLIQEENINIYSDTLDIIITNLIQRILQKEEETESLELIRSFSTNIQINSFQSSPSREKQGPKLVVTSKPLQEPPQEEEMKMECAICMNKKGLSEMQDGNCPCKDHSFCNECIKSYLKNLIDNSQVEEIKCPYDGCSQAYTEHYLSIIINAQLFEKYQRFKRIKEIMKKPNVKWCPRLGCQEYVEGPPRKGQEFLLCNCGERICQFCGYPYHEGVSCEVNISINRFKSNKNSLDQTYREALKKYIIQPCPQCKAPIQKLSGCNHMTCFKCRYQFCWLCRMKYFSGHYKRMNLLGCYGGQFDNQKPSKCPVFRIAILVIPRLILLIVMVLFRLLRLFFYVIWWSIYIPQSFAKNIPVTNQLLRNKQPRWKYRLLILFLIFIGIMFLPLTLTLLIAPGSCYLLYKRIRR